ncbi:MAG: hypothetical protein E7773_14800 [Sphingomonas sp.]|uniref:hypothetical protein n=1 Tax=Sphingomonas sp. TaxID=28214 RepID=UPI00120979B5|nr:hypothetical protein [Sphingomonas sp.]THD34455.1 MAG: hypothetical protein E7773_14800 [Sphingomonas sp.]
MRIVLGKVGQRTVVRVSSGVSRQASLLMTAVLIGYKKSGRDMYRTLLERFLNFRMDPDEPDWACLFESNAKAVMRVIAWLEQDLGLHLELTEFGDGSYYVSKLKGPLNYWMRGPSVVRRLFDILRSPKFQLRGGQNPTVVKDWDKKTRDERMEHLVNVYGPEMAKRQIRNAGTLFISSGAEVYTPSGQDPDTLAEKQYLACRALLGDHAVTNIACVNRDDGQRWADLNFTTFAFYDLEIDILGSNKGGVEDEEGRRQPSKPVTFSEEARDGIHRCIEARHAADPSFPNLATLRRWWDEENYDELDKWYVFFQPGTNEHYSYNGYHRLEVKALTAAKVFVFRRGKLRPATSRWARRALHEREYLRIHRTNSDKKVIAYLEQKLSDERGHKSPQHHNYASHAKWVLAREEKIKRIAEDKARREGNDPAPRPIPGATRGVLARQKARRSPATSKFKLAATMRGSAL